MYEYKLLDALLKDVYKTLETKAPAFREDDYRCWMAHGIIAKGDNVPCPVNLMNGSLTEEVTDFAGTYVKDADKGIIAHIKEQGNLVEVTSLNHRYPSCWRSEMPLIYRAVPSWFVAVESIKEKMLVNNKTTYLVPSYVKENEDGKEVVVIDSIAELEELSGKKVTDLHRHFIDHLTIPSRQGKGVLCRIEDVFDCWFESGAMPYAQLHYPFENKELFETNFPADFVAEGLDQTCGW
eukprot:gene31959-16098_t